MQRILSFFSFKSFENKKLHNPYYYLTITCLIAVLHLWHVFLRVPFFSFLGLKLGMIAICEALLEGALLCLMGSLLQTRKALFRSFMVICALDPLIHLIDYILERLFNLSFWRVIESFLHEKTENLIEYAYATNLPLWMWVFGFFCLIAIPFMFVFVYRMASKVIYKNLVDRSIKLLMICMLGLFVVYLPLRLSLSFPLSLSQWVAKMLPFKAVFFPEKEGALLTFQNKADHLPLFAPLTEGEDVYLFIVESLRDEAINEHTAPFIFSIGKQYYRHPYTLASANGTQLSWFSFFYGQTPLHWKDEGLKGSPYLAHFKEQGYKIYVQTAARLSYYGMDKLLFGNNHQLIERLYCPKHQEAMSAYEADKACFDDLKQSLLVPEEGKKVFITFLDATHFGYSLPKQTQMIYDEYAGGIPYFDILFTRFNPKQVKKRYYNAIHALDALFGDFFAALQAAGKWEKATILFTGDHGEEFLEKGQIFHASHLSQEQLHVPCVIKTPDNLQTSLPQEGIFSHRQMLPMIVSLLSKTSFHIDDVQMSTRYLFNKIPKEVVLSKEDEKVFLSFHAKEKTFHFKGLFNAKDQLIQQTPPSWLESYFNETAL